MYPGMKRAAWGFMQSGDFPVPVLWLKFGKNTGDKAKDSSPEGNDGTIYGATWVEGYLGPGLDFDGLDDYVRVEDDPSLRLRSALTVIARIKPATGIGAADYSALIAGKGTNCYFLTLRTTTTPRVTSYLSIEADWKILQGDTDVSLDEFHTVGMTYDGEKQKVYLDGTLDGERDQEGLTQLESSFFRVGMYVSAPTFKGIIDEVLVFDETLTAAQIRQLSLGYR